MKLDYENSSCARVSGFPPSGPKSLVHRVSRNGGLSLSLCLSLSLSLSQILGCKSDCTSVRGGKVLNKSAVCPMNATTHLESKLGWTLGRERCSQMADVRNENCWCTASSGRGHFGAPADANQSTTDSSFISIVLSVLLRTGIIRERVICVPGFSRLICRNEAFQNIYSGDRHLSLFTGQINWIR